MEPTRSTKAVTSSLLSRLVQIARTRGGTTETSIREFARQIDVSHTVITRIESGQVSKPHRDVLARIATGSDREPAPLMYAAGHISAQEFRNRLKPLFGSNSAIAAALREEVEYEPSSLNMEEIDRRLRARTVAAEELDELAEAVFSVDLHQPGYEARAIGSFLADDAPTAVALQEVLDVWGYIEPSAREDLLEYARSLRSIADLEYQAGQRAAELETRIGGTGS